LLKINTISAEYLNTKIHLPYQEILRRRSNPSFHHAESKFPITKNAAFLCGMMRTSPDNPSPL
jgi:hypothetical protein